MEPFYPNRKPNRHSSVDEVLQKAQYLFEDAVASVHALGIGEDIAACGNGKFRSTQAILVSVMAHAIRVCRSVGLRPIPVFNEAMKLAADEDL